MCEGGTQDQNGMKRVLSVPFISAVTHGPLTSPGDIAAGPVGQCGKSRDPPDKGESTDQRDKCHHIRGLLAPVRSLPLCMHIPSHVSSPCVQEGMHPTREVTALPLLPGWGVGALEAGGVGE